VPTFADKVSLVFSNLPKVCLAQLTFREESLGSIRVICIAVFVIMLSSLWSIEATALVLELPCTNMLAMLFPSGVTCSVMCIGFD